MALGTAELFARPFKNRMVGVAFGTFMAGVLRFLCSFLSGVLVWGNLNEGLSAWTYSLVYNASYMLPETCSPWWPLCCSSRWPRRSSTASTPRPDFSRTIAPRQVHRPPGALFLCKNFAGNSKKVLTASLPAGIITHVARHETKHVGD